MRRIQLQIYAHPGAADITCNLKRADGSYLRLTATIDTGAVVSLFPKIVLDEIAHRATGNEIEIEQAGIAQQVFKVQQGYITLFFEDAQGNQTEDLEILAWFTNTKHALIGFEDVLDRAVLHLDMAGAREGYLEI